MRHNAGRYPPPGTQNNVIIILQQEKDESEDMKIMKGRIVDFQEDHDNLLNINDETTISFGCCCL